MKFLKNLLLLLITLQFSVALFAQNYAVGYKRETLRDASRSRSIGVLIYYPATAAGQDQPVLHNGTKFPVVAVGHGFLMLGEQYSYIADKLCPQGYIVIIPKTEEGLPPNHGEYGKDEVFCALDMVRRDTLTNDFFNGVVAHKKAIGGHSMGGGAVFLGLQNNPAIDAFFALAPAETFIGGSAVNLAHKVRIPGLIFTGTYDKVAPKAGNGGFMYNNLLSTCKTLVEIKGGSHCNFSNEAPDVCEVGEVAVCLGCPFISNADQHNTIFKYLEPWLNYWLKNEPNGLTTIAQQGPVDSKILFTNNCSTVTGIKQNAQYSGDAFMLYPNPASNQLQISTHTNGSAFEIIGIDGRVAHSITKNWHQGDAFTIDITDLAAGLYIARYTTETGINTLKFIKE